MKTRKFSKLLVVIVIMVVIAIFGSFFTSFNDHTYIATVTDKNRIVKTDSDGNIESYYLVFCEDAEGNFYEFKNEDLFIRGKFKSSTIQNQLKVGEKYEFTVVGFRIGIFSWYENILKFKKV